MTRSDTSPEGAAPPDGRAKAASPARVVAFQTGLPAESRAAAFLIAKGYRILERNQRTPFGEIDLIARRGRLVALGTPHELLNNAGNEFVSSLLSAPKRQADRLEALVAGRGSGGPP